MGLKFRITSTDKQYLAALVVIIGIVIFWRGIWDTLYLIPIVENPFVSLFIGLLIITLSGVIFKEFDPLSRKTAKTMEILNEMVSRKGKKDGYEILYLDEKKKSALPVSNSKIKKMEHNFLVIEEKDRELFIPVHRIQKIKQDGKTIWSK